MSGDDDHARRLRLFDAHAHDFIVACRARAELGDRIARMDVVRLGDLAAMVVESVGAWHAVANDLELAAASRLPVADAARVIGECVFDEILDPAAAGLFAAALDLSLERR